MTRQRLRQWTLIALWMAAFGVLIPIWRTGPNMVSVSAAASCIGLAIGLGWAWSDDDD